MKNKETEKRIVRAATRVTSNIAFGMAGAAIGLLATGTADGWTGARLLLGAAGIIMVCQLMRRDDILDAMTNEDE